MLKKHHGFLVKDEGRETFSTQNMYLASEVEELIENIIEQGCPTYTDTTPNRTRWGCQVCFYCDANLERKEAHAPDCLWLTIVAAVPA